MFVREGARKKLTDSEREKFLSEEWPAMVTRIRQLGLDVSKLLQTVIEKEGDS
jgi:GntR family transcriptional regulator